MQFLELRIPPVAQVIIFAIAMWALSTVFPGCYLALPVFVAYMNRFQIKPGKGT